MKLLLAILLTFVYSLSFSQSSLNFQEVIKLDSSITKNELFSRARAWFSSSFVESKNVLDVQDKESGELIGKGTFYCNSKWNGNGIVEFRIKIIVKDGRYKYEISNIKHKANCGGSTNCASYGLLTNDKECPYNIRCLLCGNNLNNKAWNGIVNTSNTIINSLIINLKIAMNKPVTGSSEW